VKIMDKDVKGECISMTNILMVAMVPHPPIIIPAVGRGETKKVANTIEAMQQVCRQVAQLKPDTVIVISPHGPVFQDAVAVFDGPRMTGDLGQFNAPAARVEVEVDTGFIAVLEESARDSGVTLLRLTKDKSYLYDIERHLDHGALVPMLYLQEAKVRASYVNITYGLYPYLDLYALGKALHKSAAALNRKVVIIASGDLSHCLTAGAPAGFRQEGPQFDAALVETLKSGKLADLFSMDENLIEKAAECGFRSLILSLGALDGQAVSSHVLSYEGPFGVGYLVATFSPLGEKAPSLLHTLRQRESEGLAQIRKGESFPVALARSTLEAYVRQRKKIAPPKEYPQEFQGAAGVFVSLKKKGQLRGCIGTTEATAPNIPREIIENAISAGTRDPRFPPVLPEELDQISYSVDVLTDPEPISSMDDLDPQHYGVIVEAGNKRGLLLPDLPGVDSSEEQVRIASEKAGIRPGEKVKLFRFQVERYL
jgi:MEMO1 family protein